MTAWHLFVWYRNNRFCGRCGTATEHDGKERMMRCPKCGNMIFPKISPAVIIAATDGDRLLLSKYAGRNFTRFALIAGYTEIGETLEQTVRREVMEEVGLRVKNIRYYKSQPWGVDGNVLMGFYCDLDGDDTIHIDENELAMAEFYDRHNLPAQDDGISLTREMIRVFQEGREPK
jgi:NAD+ diphosphatase